MAEQLEAAQAAYAEMETELRRPTVQSEQWRKAAEAATAMLLAGNNNGHFMEITGSMDSNCSPLMGNINSPYADDIDKDMLKKKNVNWLRGLVCCGRNKRNRTAHLLMMITISYTRCLFLLN